MDDNEKPRFEHEYTVWLDEHGKRRQRPYRTNHRLRVGDGIGLVDGEDWQGPPRIVTDIVTEPERGTSGEVEALQRPGGATA